MLFDPSIIPVSRHSKVKVISIKKGEVVLPLPTREHPHDIRT